MDELVFFLLGVWVAGVVRISFGQFVIFSGGKWVMRWIRFDEKEAREKDRISDAYALGFQAGSDRARAAERGRDG